MLGCSHSNSHSIHSGENRPSLEVAWHHEQRVVQLWVKTQVETSLVVVRARVLVVPAHPLAAPDGRFNHQINTSEICMKKKITMCAHASMTDMNMHDAD